jgi:acyl-CoA-binding protein
MEVSMQHDQAIPHTLVARFERAAQMVQNLASSSSGGTTVRPTNAEQLQLYAFYKQATLGDVKGSRPSVFDQTGRAKWDAWLNRRGMSKGDAMQEYILTLASVLKRFPDHPQAINYLETLDREQKLQPNRDSENRKVDSLGIELTITENEGAEEDEDLEEMGWANQHDLDSRSVTSNTTIRPVSGIIPSTVAQPSRGILRPRSPPPPGQPVIAPTLSSTSPVSETNPNQSGTTSPSQPNTDGVEIKMSKKINQSKSKNYKLLLYRIFCRSIKEATWWSILTAIVVLSLGLVRKRSPTLTLWINAIAHSVITQPPS